MWTVLFIAFPAFSGILLSIGVLRMKRPFFTLALHSVALLDVLISEQDDDEKFEAVNAQTSKTVKSLLLNLSALICAHRADFLHLLLPPRSLLGRRLARTAKAFCLRCRYAAPLLVPQKETECLQPHGPIIPPPHSQPLPSRKGTA